MDEIGDAPGKAGAFLADGSKADEPLRKMEALKKNYERRSDLLKGFEKDKRKLEAGLRTIEVWVTEVESFKALGA